MSGWREFFHVSVEINNNSAFRRSLNTLSKCYLVRVKVIRVKILCKMTGGVQTRNFMFLAKTVS